MDFDPLALGFTSEFAEQRERPAADREVPAIVLDAAHSSSGGTLSRPRGWIGIFCHESEMFCSSRH